MDMTASLAAKSDQLNALDLTGPQTFTIERVTKGSDDQPFNFHLVGLPGRPYRPSKGMRRVMVRAWGPDPETYVGYRLTLVCNPDVTWAGAAVGGIQISAMSNLKPGLFPYPLTVSKTKRVMHTVDPLPDVPPVDVEAVTDQNELRDLWNKRPDLRDAITARVNELKEQAS